jgi:hypothetical protein
MKMSFMSSAELEAKLKKTRNRKKRRAIVRVLYARWFHTIKPLADNCPASFGPLGAVNFGALE